MSEKLGMMNLKLERVVAESRVSQEKVGWILVSSPFPPSPFPSPQEKVGWILVFIWPKSKIITFVNVQWNKNVQKPKTHEVAERIKEEEEEREALVMCQALVNIYGVLMIHLGLKVFITTSKTQPIPIV